MRTLLSYWRQPLGIGLAAAHAITLAFVIAAKEPLPPPRSDDEACLPEVVCFDTWNFAGQIVVAHRPFHFHYETLLTKTLMLGDLPSLLVVDITLGVAAAIFELTWRVSEPPLDAVIVRQASSYLLAFCWFVFGSLQWWIVGMYVWAKGGVKK
ncbi:MAG: hypothetical protein O2968_04220 [Acidobacteria bacterium]|nr:hypothetical protein [Acidobacteriota bacterium]